MVDKALFSSNRSNWETPPEVFVPLHKRYGFTLDVCADRRNYKVRNYIDANQDALSGIAWNGRCWMNPPYGRKVGDWVRRAAEEREGNPECELVVCLLAARTDVKWFHEIVLPRASELLFIQGRVNFLQGGQRVGVAPFPSMVVVFSADRFLRPNLGLQVRQLTPDTVSHKTRGVARTAVSFEG